MIETIILVLVLFILVYFWKYKRPSNYPPGPKPLPFVGNTFQFPSTGNFFVTVDKWSKEYGPIIGTSLFSQLLVLVSGVDNVTAALRKEEFQSRPDVYTATSRSFGKQIGIFFGAGEQWASSRKFTMKQLKALNKSEDFIAEEVSRLLDTIKDGTIIQGDRLFSIPAVNVIWTIVANKRIDLNDEKSKKFLKVVYLIFRGGNPSGTDIVNVFPILSHIIPKYKLGQRLMKEFQDYIRDTIREHREVLDMNNPIDFIDNYLVEMEKNKSNSSGQYFTEEDLIIIGVDFFGAGAESNSNTIEFVMLYMILYPEVQAKMQEEIDRVLGRSRKPMLEDKNEMHYTLAVLNEVERLNSIAPTTAMHLCTKDTTLGGYFIPKGTVLSMDLHSLGYDPKYWDNPEEFKPERFLDSEGKYTKSPFLHSFGLGQRGCIGETLARNTIFIFATTFFEKFSISLPPGEPKPTTVPLPGFTSAPVPFKIAVKSRY